jgi:F420H(2)-dependent quinone reductase
VTNADDDYAARVEQVHDSPTGWVAAHVRRYLDSGGTQGHRWNGVDTLLITTRGRKTGQLRRTALIYGRDGDRYVVVGSNGGRPEMAAIFPQYDHYQKKTAREIPVVILETRDS